MQASKRWDVIGLVHCAIGVPMAGFSLPFQSGRLFAVGITFLLLGCACFVVAARKRRLASADPAQGSADPHATPPAA